MKATVRQIFSEVSYLNPTTSVISSLGSYISQSSQMISDSAHQEIVGLLPTDSLAYKIMMNTTGRYTDKQLWVIAFELEKNTEYAEMLGKKMVEERTAVDNKIAASNAKKAANKEATRDVLDFVKSSGKKLGDYYSFLKKNRNFSKEFYSKKYTMISAIAFVG